MLTSPPSLKAALTLLNAHLTSLNAPLASFTSVPSPCTLPVAQESNLEFISIDSRTVVTEHPNASVRAGGRVDGVRAVRPTGGRGGSELGCDHWGRRLLVLFLLFLHSSACLSLFTSPSFAATAWLAVPSRVGLG